MSNGFVKADAIAFNYTPTTTQYSLGLINALDVLKNSKTPIHPSIKLDNYGSIYFTGTASINGSYSGDLFVNVSSNPNLVACENGPRPNQNSSKQSNKANQTSKDVGYSYWIE